MDALDLLRKQHAQVRTLLVEIRRSEGDERRAWSRELVDHLAAHAIIEEKLFYPAVAADAAVLDVHLGSPSHEDHDTTLRLFEEHLERHVEVLEGELFTVARRRLEPDQLRVLGAQMKRMFDDQMCAVPIDAAVP